LLIFIIVAIIVILISGAFIAATLGSLEFAILVVGLCLLGLAVYVYQSRES